MTSLHVADLLGLDLDVGRLAAGAAERLVDHDARVRAARGAGPWRPPRGAPRPSTRPCRGTSCVTGRADVLHGVVDREAARHHAAGAVDVEHDLLVGILALQEEKLGDDDVGDVVVDLGAEEDDAVLEQAAEDVPVALAAVRRLDDRRVRDEVLASLEASDRLRAVLGTAASWLASLGSSSLLAWPSLGLRPSS